MTAGNALIGHTGFVGSNLARQGSYAAFFNSRNIGDIAGAYDRIVCAGVSAKKWVANKEPEADLAAIRMLMANLDKVEASHFTLISTIDVFQDSTGLDEASEPKRDGLHPYGLNRLYLEDYVRSRFPDHLILRLPALYGQGLRKNIIFDLLNQNMVENINPNTCFQWYPVSRLQHDIDLAIGAALPLAHLATEPCWTTDILSRFFPDVATGPSGPLIAYDFRTRFAEVFGGRSPYVMSKDQILDDLGIYIEAERSA